MRNCSQQTQAMRASLKELLKDSQIRKNGAEQGTLARYRLSYGGPRTAQFVAM